MKSKSLKLKHIKKLRKLTLQINSFFYTRMIDFPNSDFLIKTFSSAIFFFFFLNV